MMAISNPADWFMPTSVPANETTTEPEVTAQSEFAALLAASYIAPAAPAAPTPVITNAAETSPKREAITAATEFVLPTDVLSLVAAPPIMTGVKAAEETIKAFPDALPTQIFSPTDSPTDQMTKAAVPPNNTTQDSNAPLLRSSEVITKANLEKFVGPEKLAEQVPNLPTPIAIEKVGNHASSVRTTTAKQVGNPRHESSFLPGVAVPEEQSVLRSADIRVSQREDWPVNASSNPATMRSQITQADASFADRSIASEQYAAIDKGQREVVSKVTLPQSQEGQEKMMPVRMESPHQATTVRKELTVVAVESLTSISPAVSQGTADVLKPAAAAVKTIVIESSVALPPLSAPALVKESLSANQATPRIVEPDAMPTTTRHAVVTQPAASPAETAPQPAASPISLRSDMATAQSPRTDAPTATAKPLDVTQILQTGMNRAPIAAEPAVIQEGSSQWPKRNPVSMPTRLTQVDGTTEEPPITPNPLPELAAPQKPLLSVPRPLQVQASTTTEPASANTPITTNNFAAPISPEHMEFSNVTARQEFTNVTVPETRTEFTHIVSSASAQEPTTGAFAAALQVEVASVETTIPSSLPTTTQPLIHQASNSHPEASAGNEAQPLVRQTIAPVLELVQRLETPSTRSLRLQLNPVELGPVEVEVKRDAEGQVSAVLKVEQAETAKTLTHSLGQLRESLERAGLVVEQLDVTFTPPLPSPTSQPFGQAFGQQTPQQPSSSSHFTNADSLPAESVGAEDKAPAADQKLLSLHA